jgi:hypothetical protein
VTPGPVTWTPKTRDERNKHPRFPVWRLVRVNAAGAALLVPDDAAGMPHLRDRLWVDATQITQPRSTETTR